MHESAYRSESYHSGSELFDSSKSHRSQEAIDVSIISVNPQDIQVGVTMSGSQHAHYESYQQAYPMPNLDFAPPAQEIFEQQPHIIHQSLYGNGLPQANNNNIPNTGPTHPDNLFLSNFTVSQQFYLNPYPTMEGPLVHDHRAKLLNQNQPVNATQNMVNQNQPVTASLQTQNSVGQEIPPGYVSYVQPGSTFMNANMGNVNQSQPLYQNMQSMQMNPISTQSFATGFKKTEYLCKRIEKDLIQRTGVIGNLDAGTTAFDDYFESHSGKFFTPELHEVIFYHDNDHIYGVQMIFRDPWGKIEKETYKGELHMPKKISPKNCARSVFTLDYDEYLTELYVHGGKDEINYFKMVSNEGNVFELGQYDPNVQLLNMVIPLTRIIGIGGTYSTCLNGVYFYYN